MTPTAATPARRTPTVPNSPMTAWALLWRVFFTLIRAPFLGRKAWVEDERLTAKQIAERYDENPLTPGLNAALRLVGSCLSQTAEDGRLNELAAYRLLKKQAHTGDPNHDCIVADAIALMQELLEQGAA